MEKSGVLLTTVFVLEDPQRKGYNLVRACATEDGGTVFEPFQVDVPSGEFGPAGHAPVVDLANKLFNDEVFHDADPFECWVTLLAYFGGDWARAYVQLPQDKIDELLEVALLSSNTEPRFLLITEEEARAGVHRHPNGITYPLTADTLRLFATAKRP